MRSARRLLAPAIASGALLFLSLAVGCARGKATIEPPRRDPGPLRAKISGCERVTRDADCALGPSRSIHVWAPEVQVASIAVSDGMTKLATTPPREVEGGLAFEVEVPAGARSVRIDAATAAGVALRRDLRIADDDAPSWLREAKALRGEGKADAAETRLAPGFAPGAPPRERAWATGTKARVELRRGHLERAVTLLREALALDRAAGLVSDESDDTQALVFVLSERQHDTAKALEALGAVADASARYDEGAMDTLYSRGLVALGSGDWRGALHLFDDARIAARRLAKDSTARAAQTQYAVQLEYLGRWREALAILQTLVATEPADAPACDRATLRVNVAEGRLLATEASAGEDVGDPIPPLEEAIALYGAGCPDDYARAMALQNVALALVRRGDAIRAKAYLARSRAASGAPDPLLVAAGSEVEGRIALAERRFAAAGDAFAREERIADASLFQVERWRGALGRAEAMEGLGATERAIEAYAAAERSLDASILAVPLGEGQGGFAADREASARALVDLLLRRHRPEQALLHARRARARVLVALARTARLEALDGEARQRWTDALDAYRRAREALAGDAAEDWKRPAPEVARAIRDRRDGDLRARAALDAELWPLASGMAAPGVAMKPPPPGAVLLTYAPLRRGWVAFAQVGGSVRAAPFDVARDERDPERLAAVLLAPFAPEIRSATEILLAPHGAVRGVDVHALPFDGAPLVASKPVRYVLDIGEGGRAQGTPDAPALVLSDPMSDLAEARAEAAFVTSALTSSSLWPVVAYAGPAVTAARMADELPRAALLHFAGHGVYSGREGWESALPLAREARWTVGDVLALSRAPERVVLSACEAARSSVDAAEGLGLAQAFVVAGAHAVVAPTRPVKDELARALSEALYTALLRGRSREASLPAALHEAQAALAAAHPGWDWAAFRALTP